VKKQVVLFIEGDATYFTNLFNIDLTDVFGATHCLSVPKITQIGSRILKKWTVKHSGPVVFDPPYRIHVIRLQLNLCFVNSNILHCMQHIIRKYYVGL